MERKQEIIKTEDFKFRKRNLSDQFNQNMDDIQALENKIYQKLSKEIDEQQKNESEQQNKSDVLEKEIKKLQQQPTQKQKQQMEMQALMLQLQQDEPSKSNKQSLQKNKQRSNSPGNDFQNSESMKMVENLEKLLKMENSEKQHQTQKEQEDSEISKNQINKTHNLQMDNNKMPIIEKKSNLERFNNLLNEKKEQKQHNSLIRTFSPKMGNEGKLLNSKCMKMINHLENLLQEEQNEKFQTNIAKQ